MRIRAVVVSLTLVVLAGCTHRIGAPVAEYLPAQEAEVSKTPYAAKYVLRLWPTPPTDPPPREWIPEQQAIEMYSRGLGRRDAIGFEKADGKLLAVAGAEKIALEPGRYTWQIDPSTEYTGWKWLIHETGERTVEIISLPFEIAGMVLVTPFVFGCFLCLWPIMLFH